MLSFYYRCNQASLVTMVSREKPKDRGWVWLWGKNFHSVTKNKNPWLPEPAL